MIVKDFRQLRRDRRTLAMIVVLPLLLLVVFGYAASFDATTISTKVVGPRAGQAAARFSAPFDVQDVSAVRCHRIWRTRRRHPPTDRQPAATNRPHAGPGRLAGDLSGGVRQKLGVVRALTSRGLTLSTIARTFSNTASASRCPAKESCVFASLTHRVTPSSHRQR